MRTKGISDIIAIVLLLMITISMVGFAWIWMQRLTLSAQNTTTSQINVLSNTSAQFVRIDNIDKTGGRLAIRNMGSFDTSVNYISIYVGGTLLTLPACGANWPNTIIKPGAVALCNTTTEIQNCNTHIRVVTSAGEDSKNC